LARFSLPPEGGWGEGGIPKGESMNRNRGLCKSPATVRRARSSRRQPTPAEAKLWRRLRDRRAQFKFRRQHPIGRYVLDFFCPEAMLAVEIDGDQHSRREQIRHDQERSAWLKVHGVDVLRVPAAEVERSVEDVIQGIWEACEKGRDK